MISIDEITLYYPQIKPYIIPLHEKDGKWGRLKCRWVEKVGDQTKENIYTPLVNLKTSHLYLDDSKKEIYIKLVIHLILRPIFTTIKTLYHVAAPISLTYIIYRTIKKGKQEELETNAIALNCLKNSLHSLSDIIRTPIYGVALMIVNIAALTIAPFASDTLYEFREQMGKLIIALYREDEDSYEALDKIQEEDLEPMVLHRDPFPCFTVWQHLLSLADWGENRLHKDTVYDSEEGFLKAFNSYGRAEIQHRRRVTKNSWCLKLGDPFQSSSYSEIINKKSLEELDKTT